MKVDGHILVRQIKEGDQSAFGIFYNAEYNNLVYFINGYTHDKAFAEDVAQDALLTLWEKRESIDENGNIRAFLYTIARNRVLNQLRAKASSKNTRRLDEINADIYALSDESFVIEAETLKLQELIEKTYANLPKAGRESFILSRKLKMTNREIAEARGISLHGIEYHIKISLNYFREKLKEYLPLLGLFLFNV